MVGVLITHEANVVRPDCRPSLCRCLLGVVVLSFCAGKTPAALAYTGVETTHRVRMYWTETFDSLGYVDIDLFGEASPRHVANFLRYVDNGIYDYSYIHRSQAGDLRFLQGGSYGYPNPFSVNALETRPITTSYGPIKNEFDASNGLSNVPGTLAAARPPGSVDTATAGWFFNVTNNGPGFDPGVYTVFGEATTGWDSFAALATQPIVSQVKPELASRPVATTPLLPASFGNYFVPILLEWTRVPLIPGDFNLDGLVNAEDELVWQASQGAFGVANLVADADGDGDVDMDDRAIWQQNFGLGELKNVVGDYNGNGEVTAADYLWWSTQFGADDILDADGNGDGVVDAADYLVWRNAYVAAGGLLTPDLGAQVPEPATLAAVVGLLGVGLWMRRKRS